MWNGKITKEGIEEQLLVLKRSGCGGVFIHARAGMITEYLSPE
ncbi:MAG: hypothetical protein AB7D05_08795 [Mangrovibacterium sp.]